MIDHNLVADLCLCSTALRCVQTAHSVLSGMERSEQAPIRIEPGLFECPHLNYKIIESFMTKKELTDNGFNLYQDYKPLIGKLTVPESLDDYFERSVQVMRGIIDRYAPRGGTILIVTHRSCVTLLAAMLNLKSIDDQLNYLNEIESHKRREVNFLSMIIAEYDATNRSWSYLTDLPQTK